MSDHMNLTQDSKETPIGLEKNEKSDVLNKQLAERRTALFVGNEYKYYYRDKFNRISSNPKDIGFNLPAFLLGFVWLFYRKMYVLGLSIIGLMVFIGFLNSYLPQIPSYSGLIVSILLGMRGNGVYYEFVRKKIKKIETEYSSDTEINEHIQKQGGVNSTIVTVFVMIFIVLVILSLIS